MISAIKQHRWPIFVVVILLATIGANAVLLFYALNDPTGGFAVVDDYKNDSATDRKSRTVRHFNDAESSK